MPSYGKIFKVLLPYTCLATFLFLGGGIAYGVDLLIAKNKTNSTVTSCISDRGYLGAVFYVTTICTTIGYGTIVACNGWSKFITMIFALCGIPMFLIVLSDVGKLACRFLNAIYIVIKRRRKYILGFFLLGERKENLSQHLAVLDDEYDDYDERYTCAPISLSIVLTLLWSALCGLYFRWLENWDYFDALYFCFINLTTMGFGGIALSTLELIRLFFGIFLLAIGMALVSMTISTVQLNIDILMSKLHADIERKFQEKLEFEAEHPFLAVADDEESPDETVARLLEENGAGFLAAVMSQGQFEQVVGEASKRNAMQSTFVQTDPKPPKPGKPILKDQAVESKVLLHDTMSQCEATSMQTEDVQCDRTGEILYSDANVQCDRPGEILYSDANVQCDRPGEILYSDANVQCLQITWTQTSTQTAMVSRSLKDAFTQATHNSAVGETQTHEPWSTTAPPTKCLHEDKSTESHPSTRTVLLQTPKWSGQVH